MKAYGAQDFTAVAISVNQRRDSAEAIEKLQRLAPEAEGPLHASQSTTQALHLGRTVVFAVIEKDGCW